MEETLSPYAQPQLSPRFDLLRVPMAQAIRFLVLGGDEAGLTALERHGAIRTSYRDSSTWVLKDHRVTHDRREWLRVADEDYVLY